MRAWCVPVLLVAAIILSSCGTATYTHDITVLVDDPSGRLGAGPVDLSIFDRDMGSSLDWAKKTMGTAGDGAPYTAELHTTRVRTILSEDLPGQIVAALAIPAYEKRGYFVVSIAPDPTAQKTIVAPFVRYGGGSGGSGEVRGGPEGSGEVREGSGRSAEVAPLPVHYTSQPGEQGWRIAITVEIPPVRSDATTADRS